ncbi:MAG: hypothetical protein ABII90_06800 [Bacteroidota bacterium]
MEQKEEHKEQAPKKDKRGKFANILFSIIVAVLFIVAAILGWQFLEQKSITEKEKTDKEAVQLELNDLLVEYEKLNVDNVELGHQLSVEKAKIKEMLGQIKKLKTDSELLWKYKKQSQTLRNLLKGYLREIDSLGTTITVLSEEKLQVESDLGKEKVKTKELIKEKAHLNEKVELGSLLKAYNMFAKGIRFKSGGKKEKEENRARKVEKIKICFTIGANTIAGGGTKNVYIRVADKNGDVFPKGGDSTNVFLYNDKEQNIEKEIVYSAIKTIDYQNQEIDLCIYFSKKEEFLPQKYTADIFVDKDHIGETLFELE